MSRHRNEVAMYRAIVGITAAKVEKNFGLAK
jgi:hypothetical protein